MAWPYATFFLQPPTIAPISNSPTNGYPAVIKKNCSDRSSNAISVPMVVATSPTQSSAPNFAPRVALVYPGRRSCVREFPLAQAPVTLALHTVRVAGDRDACRRSLRRFARSLAG